MLTPVRPPAVAAVFMLNLGLALLAGAGAPDEPRLTDRSEYEYAGQHLFAPDCPRSIYCYRLLVPALLEQVPLEPRLRWRVYQVTANAAAGTLLAVATASLTMPPGAPALASVIAQMSYGFTFTAYDPYTADPLVFVASALLALCWIRNWPVAALVVGVIGVFAKETVALVAAAAALAALLDRQRPHRAQWIAQGAIAFAVLLGFHWVMDTFYGWSMARNPAARFTAGSWLAIWWRNNPLPLRKALLLFAPFGFAWLFAAAGWRGADRRLRLLAIGAVLPMLALVYVQTPERALGNAFFVVAPLAATLLARAPIPAVCAVAANGLFTAKMGLSSPWLPSSALLLPLAALASAAALRAVRQAPRTGASMA